MWKNKKIMLFTLNFIIYSIILFSKYVHNSASIKLSTVIEGYFFVNLFFLIIIFPAIGIHKLLREKDYFLNNEIFSKILQIIFLIGTYMVLIGIPFLKMPLDVMSSSILWLYLYFGVIFKSVRIK